MSDQPPKKRMKAGVTRVRTGCYTCRRRKVKCDETKPICGACRKLDLRCDGYALRYKFCDPQTADPVQWQGPSPADSTGHDAAQAKTLPHPATQNAGNISYSPDFISTLLSNDSPDSGLLDNNGHDTFDDTMSPSYGAFLDAVWNYWPDSHSSLMDGNIPMLYPTTDTSPSTNDTASPDPHSLPLVSQIRDPPTPLSPPSPPYYDTSNPSTSLSSQRTYYFAQWHTTVSPLLPPVFRDMATHQMPGFPPLHNAILAISASYTAHVESLMVRSAHRSRKSSYIPQKDHRYQSLQYYAKAVQGINVENVPQSLLLGTLATLLLCYYFEIDTGSFSGGMRHMDTLDKLMQTHHAAIKTLTTGKTLFSTWMNLRSQLVNRYLWSYPKSVRKLDLFPLNRSAMDTEGSHHDTIMVLTSESKLLSRKMVLDYCVTRGVSRGPVPPLDHILAQVSLPMSRPEEEEKEADESYDKALAQQRARLDAWHATLDLSERPVESYVSETPPTSDTLRVHPLKFHTFEAAMNYAHYAHAQMLCADNAMDRIKNLQYISPAFTRQDCPWGELLLRITAGLDLDDCVYKNTFRPGLLLILTSLVVLRPRPDVAAWIDEWVHRVGEFGVPLDSGLPFGIIQRVIRFVLEQRKNGSDALLILPLDTEDADKSVMYQSDFRMQVVVCGKDLQTGELYHETVDIPEC